MTTLLARLALLAALSLSALLPDDDEIVDLAPVQRVLLVVNGPDDARGFGTVLAPAGDLDGDGSGDLLVGAPQLSHGAIQGPGRVLIVSGADGHTLATLHGDLAGEAFGSAVALLSDLDGDGRPEVLVGAPRHDEYAINAGVARVHSSKDGSLLMFKRSRQDEPEPLQILGEEPFGYLGTSVAASSDLDGDGVDDFLVGGPSDPTQDALPGQVVVVSGSNGDVLARHWGDSSAERFGQALASVPDRDGDGADDIAVSAPGALDDDGTPAGRVLLISARSGKVLLQLRGRAGERFGSSLAIVDDIDGDDVFELLVGAPGATPNGPESGSAYLLSGADGAILGSYHGAAAYDQFGFAVAAPGDVDGDGQADLLVGSHGADPGGYGSGGARMISAVDGRTVLEVTGEHQGLGLGYAVSAVGDLDGDDLADVALGQLGREGAPSTVGALRIIAGVRPPPEDGEETP